LPRYDECVRKTWKVTFQMVLYLVSFFIEVVNLKSRKNYTANPLRSTDFS